jgi:hypothetical protein
MQNPTQITSPLEAWQQKMQERHGKQDALLESIKNHMTEINELLKNTQDHWIGEDAFYRFYHQSLKVYRLQNKTEEIYKLFQKIGQQAEIEPNNPYFLEIFQAGTGKTFTLDHNQRWLQETRPIIEAFFHARELLHLHSLYGKKLATAPPSLPSGWAAVLYLYNIR